MSVDKIDPNSSETVAETPEFQAMLEEARDFLDVARKAHEAELFNKRDPKTGQVMRPQPYFFPPGGIYDNTRYHKGRRMKIPGVGTETYANGGYGYFRHSDRVYVGPHTGDMRIYKRPGLLGKEGKPLMVRIKDTQSVHKIEGYHDSRPGEIITDEHQESIGFEVNVSYWENDDDHSSKPYSSRPELGAHPDSSIRPNPHSRESQWEDLRDHPQIVEQVRELIRIQTAIIEGEMSQSGLRRLITKTRSTILHRPLTLKMLKGLLPSRN
ncbi:hypothetical protein KJ742_02190 [Patescibacteria group bacterium]|nr:hypothetical protein [Patescibacteria group bacterium]MBU1682732.1 hypothetical protein [Patescibacteria group bacterium]MBU1934892.1 hypothetical protein [Patescibacteria group bacterium]